MSVGPVQIIIVVLLVLIFFGRGRISEMMGDFGKGISSFKKGLNEGQVEATKDDEDVPPKRIPDKRSMAEKAAERDRDNSLG